MITAVVHRLLPASVDETWRALTQSSLVSAWLGDVDRLAPGESFRCDLGDGDVLTGRMGAWYQGRTLELTAKFMDLGPPLTIDYTLRANGGHTFVTIRERTDIALPATDDAQRRWEAAALRLEAWFRQRRPAARPWCDTIRAIAATRAPASVVCRTVQSPDWWCSMFPDANVTLASDAGTRIRATLRHLGEGTACETHATVSIDTANQTTIHMVHAGWGTLPEVVRARERRRGAEQWIHALQALEQSAAMPRRDRNSAGRRQPASSQHGG